MRSEIPESIPPSDREFKAEPKSFEKPNVDDGFINTQEYLSNLRRAGECSLIAPLDRSEFFRHKKDFKIFSSAVKEARESGKKLNFLEIGIGNMEEPISYLAAANSELSDSKLEDLIDMELVEIRNREEVKANFRLGKQMFAPDQPVKPKAYQEAFTLVDGEYEPNSNIKQYLKAVMDDELKAHFDTAVENFTRSCERQYDIVSCNNVIQHLGGIEGYSTPYKKVLGEQTYDRFYEEITRILNLVKEGGKIFIHAPIPGNNLDTKSRGAGLILNNLPKFNEEFEELSSGVYRRRAKKENKD